MELNKPDPFADNLVENSYSTIENWLKRSLDNKTTA